MSAMDRWRERCEREPVTASLGCGIVYAIRCVPWAKEAEQAERRLILVQDNAHPHSDHLPGLRLALTWLREEVERGE